MPFLKPHETVSEEEISRGLRALLFDGMCSQVMGVLTGGAFLVAFALLLGASNKVIGLLGAVGPFTQILQIPAIFLVDRLRHRKALVVIPSFFSRLSWLAVALTPWFVPEAMRLPVFVGALLFYFGLGSISGCAFNSWMRDFIPENIMGSYFAKRLALSIGLGAGLSLAAAVGVDFFKQNIGPEMGAYSILFSIGSVAGLTGIFFLSRIPEPKMAITPGTGLFKMLVQPFGDYNFRRLIFFLGSWNFAVNLAAPFFTVYMLKRLGMSMTWVLAFAVVSQLVNVAFLRIWGRLADRFTNKSVLTVSGPLFIVSIALWPFTTMPEQYFLTVPLLLIIHALAGMSTAGVLLCTSNIALKLAPRGAATAYLATNSLISGLAATVAPILAGFGADWFVGRELSLTLRWASNGIGEVEEFLLPALNFKGLDFLFVFAVIAGFYALHRLLAVREEGEVEEDVVITELYAEVRKAVRHISNVAGLRQLTYFPFSSMRYIVRRMSRGNRHGRNATGPLSNEAQIR